MAADRLPCIAARLPMHRHQLLIAMTFSALVLGNMGCRHDNVEDLYPLDFCDTAAVTYSITIQPIVESNCAVSGCHVPGGSGSGDFTSYAGVKSQVVSGRLIPSIQQADNAVAMPPDGKLSDCEIGKIAIWVELGAPQN